VFSALTRDRVRGVIIAGCRAGRCFGSSGQGRCCQPGSGKARSDGEQPAQRLGFGHPSGPDNDSVWVR
jgi:hypothetical protein